MKISYNWLRQFINTELSTDEISQILTAIGLEVESVEKVQTIPGGLEGLVIGYVKECVQHPNADRLRITKVDVGAGEDLQVVCGASNVAAGQKVVVATVGATVYPTSGEPFKINKSKIRGEVSEGMICAEDEIGLGASHEGIMVLSEDALTGTSARKYFQISDDYLFEIGLTPNRADAASHLGVARDLAAYLRSEVNLPDVSAFKADNDELKIPVRIENERACPRYSSLTITGVTVKESPDWLKDKLKVIGVRTVNNIVDVTNYVLHELGQPLHAFDADKIEGAEVVVKNCEEGTTFITLDEVERKLSAEDLMICNTEAPMCIAGVFGGITSGVNESTANVFLESAYFNSVAVRKTSKRHGLKTDASFRFERGTDPEMTVFALKRAALLIKEVAGGEISSEISDLYPIPVAPFEVSVSYKNVNRLIGADIPVQTIKEIIQALGIRIKDDQVDKIVLEVPSFKVDVTREVDIIEEVLRIYGYNNIAIPSQIRASLNTSVKPDKEAVQNQIADMLTANGFSEILSNSLTKGLYDVDSETAVRILNPLSSDLDTMRQTLLYSGLEAIAYNQNRKNPDLKLYEFGKVYFKTDSGYNENFRLSLFMTGRNLSQQWNHTNSQVTFYNLKGAVDAIVKRLNISGLMGEAIESADFKQGYQYKKGDQSLVSFGMVSKAALKKLDIDREVFYADFNWDLVLKAIRKNKISFKDVPKTPSVRRDLSLLIDRDVTFQQLQSLALKAEKAILKDVNLFDVYEGEKLSGGKKSYALSFLLQDDEKTLTDKQIDSVMTKLIGIFEKELGAEVRK
ncbi:phenylalanine--tRNA ligase subunit beta [Paradesertivirga mongoliensis]|uniref:Phenylalanine--tRNA ligase beta subunit n=1 Tax=Paradesertivirga mongoliensis TaxID=2100740 RepID=A0ABW4ZHE5_9SPHI|nr:phenylalanine--tRNA ligase subunit beta [Pedobacter mongoliensis]